LPWAYDAHRSFESLEEENSSEMAANYNAIQDPWQPIIKALKSGTSDNNAQITKSKIDLLYRG
jgi:hypothetical protein